MKICYYGHSCFILSCRDYTIALDPYDASVPGYPALDISADAVYCSHSHFDHNYTAAVRLSGTDKEDPFSVSEYQIPHDKEGGSKRGMNTIRVFEADGKKVVHMGDTGCMPGQDILDAIKGADALLIPVGGFFTIDAAEAKQVAEAVKPALVIPMHYRNGSSGLPMIATLSEFLDICSGSDLKICPLEYGQGIEI